jgi:hypothetical protein
MKKYHEFLFKAVWDATALKLVVPGKNYADAEKRVESMVRRMEGGISCLEIKYLAQLS